jgi:hypothetical protein
VSSERRTDGCRGNDRGGACEETRDVAEGSPVVKQTMRARKAHSLIGEVYDWRNLRLAWERVKKNKGAGGVDGVTIARFDENLEHYLDVLHRQLKDGRYRPRPVKRVEIDKPCAGEPHARFEVAAGGNQASRASTCRAAQAPLADPTNCFWCKRAI